MFRQFSLFLASVLWLQCSYSFLSVPSHSGRVSIARYSSSLNLPKSVGEKRIRFWQPKEPNEEADASPVSPPSLSDLKSNLLGMANEFKILQREYFLDKEANKFTDKYQRLGDLEEEIINICTGIGELYPPVDPFNGWMDPDSSARCPLDGRWSLRFTTAPDATFKPNPKLGNAATSQNVDSKSGFFINEIDFDGTGTSKVIGFRVFVEGRPREGTNDVDLKFRKVTLLRNSRFPRLFGKISFRVPSISSLSALSRLFNIERGQRGINSKRPSKTIIFVDDDMRIHKSSAGLWFVQSKLANRVGGKGGGE